ncbi:MAG TPA: MarR family winged helix-turn-helix transcriptional regulator [Steroidobacteraceae bacterium]|jgi:DNA-binding MarR family transcriptional regulator|nr:MarR family winged helix-turn-helix transcriptional regulator [Steroidobacteraceae bacterium]
MDSTEFANTGVATPVPGRPDVSRRPLSVALEETQTRAPGSVDMDILPDLLGYNVRTAQLALQRSFTRTMANSDIGAGVFGLLVLCGANAGIAQIQVARHLNIDKASVVALVDRMEESGWVVRRRSTEDRRRHGLFLTAEGTRQLKGLKKQMQQREESLSELFSEDERRQLISLLQRIRP